MSVARGEGGRSIVRSPGAVPSSGGPPAPYYVAYEADERIRRVARKLEVIKERLEKHHLVPQLRDILGELAEELRDVLPPE